MLCVDGVIVNKTTKKVLLFRRDSQSVCPNELWFAGGRSFKEESLMQTLFRKLESETGLTKSQIRKIPKLLGYSDMRFYSNATHKYEESNREYTIHTPAFLFLVSFAQIELEKIKPSDGNTNYGFFDIEQILDLAKQNKLHPYVLIGCILALEEIDSTMQQNKSLQYQIQAIKRQISPQNFVKLLQVDL
jgi:ADP-ribose pyrophosphatase YjhB (NUDIX family)